MVPTNINRYTNKENNVYYCSECIKIYNACYEYDNINMCRTCFSDVEIIPENKIIPFIRKMRLKHLTEVSDKIY